MSEGSITILSESDARPHPPGATLFKQSILRWMIALAFLEGIATFLAVTIIKGWTPWPLWFGVGLLLSMTPLVVKGLIRSLAPTNWIARIDADSLLVHFRSIHRSADPGAMTACRIPLTQISAARTVTERFARLENKNSEKWSERSLEIQLEPGCANDLFLAIHDDRASNAIDPTTGDKKKLVLHHYPVRMPDPEILRIKFQGRRDHVTPRDRTALETLSAHCQIEEPHELDYTKPAKLSQLEFDEALLSLAESGQLFAAIHYLKSRTSCSLSDARDTIDQLLGHKPLDLSGAIKAA